MNIVLKNKTDHLHIIRGVAALLVVILHARFILWCGGVEFSKAEHPLFEKVVAYGMMLLFTSGKSMVMCFFLLSGFFLKISFESNTITKFYVNRIVRIYVPYLFSIACACAALFICFKYINPAFNVPFGKHNAVPYCLFRAYHEMDFDNFLRSLVFWHKADYIGWNFPYWSLLYEAIFYLTIALSLYQKKAVFVIAVIAYIAGFLVRFSNPFLIYFFDYLIFFQAGICLHYIIDSTKVEAFFKKNKATYVLIFSLAVYLMLCFFQLKNMNRVANLLGGFLGVTFIFLLYHRPDVVLKRAFFNFLKWLGNISFSLYLIHVVFLYLIYAVVTRITGIYIIYAPFYLLAVPLALTFGYGFYILVEKKSLQLKHYLNKYLTPLK